MMLVDRRKRVGEPTSRLQPTQGPLINQLSARQHTKHAKHTERRRRSRTVLMSGKGCARFCGSSPRPLAATYRKPSPSRRSSVATCTAQMTSATLADSRSLVLCTCVCSRWERGNGRASRTSYMESKPRPKPTRKRHHQAVPEDHHHRERQEQKAGGQGHVDEGEHGVQVVAGGDGRHLRVWVCGCVGVGVWICGCEPMQARAR